MNTNFEKTARKVSKIRKNRTPQQPPANTFYKSISNHIGNNKLRYGVGATLPLTASAGYLLSENKDTFNDPEFKKVRNDILAGSISGAISGAAVHPVDN